MVGRLRPTLRTSQQRPHRRALRPRRGAHNPPRADLRPDRRGAINHPNPSALSARALGLRRRQRHMGTRTRKRRSPRRANPHRPEKQPRRAPPAHSYATYSNATAPAPTRASTRRAHTKRPRSLRADPDRGQTRRALARPHTSPSALNSAGLRLCATPSRKNSEAKPASQGRPDRAEHSEPRSGALYLAGAAEPHPVPFGRSVVNPPHPHPSRRRHPQRTCRPTAGPLRGSPARRTSACWPRKLRAGSWRNRPSCFWLHRIGGGSSQCRHTEVVYRKLGSPGCWTRQRSR